MATFFSKITLFENGNNAVVVNDHLIESGIVSTEIISDKGDKTWN